MLIGIVIGIWISLSLLLGILGQKRHIGFRQTFWTSMLLSPVVGFWSMKGSPKHRPEPEGIDALHHSGEAMLSYQQGNYDRAIHYYKLSLQVREESHSVHFSLACLYSLKKMKNEAFQHLQKAVEYGMKYPRKIYTHTDLEYLREQPEFDEFSERLEEYLLKLEQATERA
ncbi:MAG: tetratricopeptide repeat protein [Bacteroidota bacterium]